MHYLLYVTYFINVTHAYASGWPLFKTYWLKFRFGITGVKRFFHQKRGDLVHPPNLTRGLGKGRMSSSLHRRMQCACVLFLLNSSTSFCQPLYLMFLQSAWTNFDETWSQWPMTKRADVQWPLNRSKVIQGQRGQKSIFSPKRIKSTRFHGMFTILIHMIAYNALYKSYGIKNSSGSFGVKGVKRSSESKKSLKNHIC